MALVLKGVSNVMRNLNREIKGIRGRTEAGLRAGATLVKGRSMRLAPVDTGHLRQSAYVDSGTVFLKGPWAIVGYTAIYAPAVHEMNKNYVVGQWKFLEEPFFDSANDVLEIIRRRAMIK
ncbi:hypothetical protein LCGC14_0717680 [marine sediment metagenome]|uniref:HK97 gp10 family phage protein n=1 Tax=marine sediment metagenome TaxID=412755 RepID=A0A0F9TKS8_9ZZZZ